MSTHNLCFEQKYEKYQRSLSENFQFLEVKFSIYLNRRVFSSPVRSTRRVSSPVRSTRRAIVVTPVFRVCVPVPVTLR